MSSRCRGRTGRYTSRRWYVPGQECPHRYTALTFRADVMGGLHESLCGLDRSTFCFPRAPLVDEQSATAATSWIACRCPMCARHPTNRAAYLKLGICVRPGVSTEPNPLGSAERYIACVRIPDGARPNYAGYPDPRLPLRGARRMCGKQCGKSVSKPR